MADVLLSVVLHRAVYGLGYLRGQSQWYRWGVDSPKGKGLES